MEVYTMPKIKTSRAAAKRFSKQQVQAKLKRNESLQEPYLNQEDN